MVLFQQILFSVVILITAWLLYKRITKIRSSILMGKPEDRSDQKGRRLKNLLLIALGQRKMFKKYIPAVLHLMIYVGFIVINIEVLEFIIDGFSGKHRIFAIFLGNLGATSVYTVLLNIFEFLGLLVLISCIAFLIRRNILQVNRFKGSEMTSWPKLDANLILIFEIILMMAIFTMDASDQLLQKRNIAGYHQTGTMVLSNFMMTPVLQHFGSESLIVIERVAWWLHIIGIFAFAVYITYSKHLHIFMAFPNAYYSDLNPAGKMSNMNEVTNEVKMMLGQPVENQGGQSQEIARLGAKDVEDLSWKSLMDAYTCTECGRCTAECPANQTGKKLSPRKIMMDVRDRVEAVGENRKNENGKDDKSLLGDYISKEELLACTACNACVEACPVMINPLTIILQMRRYMAMEESSTPQSWNSMFSNIETSFAPWKFPPADRSKWIQEMSNDKKDSQ